MYHSKAIKVWKCHLYCFVLIYKRKLSNWEKKRLFTKLIYQPSHYYRYPNKGITEGITGLRSVECFTCDIQLCLLATLWTNFFCNANATPILFPAWQGYHYLSTYLAAHVPFREQTNHKHLKEADIRPTFEDSNCESLLDWRFSFVQATFSAPG